MTAAQTSTSKHGGPTASTSRRQMGQAERDYYDCLARFGHESAEAYVAEMVWRRLRRSQYFD